MQFMMTFKILTYNHKVLYIIIYIRRLLFFWFPCVEYVYLFCISTFLSWKQKNSSPLKWGPNKQNKAYILLPVSNLLIECVGLVVSRLDQIQVLIIL